MIAHTLAHASYDRQRLPIQSQKPKIEMMDGVLIIDKPAGFTSHDVVARVRRIMKEKRVGHTGTLDPFATGVLVVLVGRATRLAQFLSGAEKEYQGIIRFGYATDTGDSTGTKRAASESALTSAEFAKSWDAETIEEALSNLRGDIEQVPPMYSAKKVAGRKLYELARQGTEIERDAVTVTVREFEAMPTEGALLKHNTDGTCDLAVRVICSAGTYVRTLAENVGERLGIPAHLFALRRTRAGNFKISEAQTLAQLETVVASNEDAQRVLLPMSAALSTMTLIVLKDGDVRRLRHGATLHSDDRLLDGEMVQLCDADGELIAVGAFNLEQKALRPRVVFVSDQ